MVTKTANLELTEVQDADVGAAAAKSFNDSYDRLDALVQLSVLSATTTAPPASPAQGDRYIVPLTVLAGNAWSDQPRRVAYYSSTGWLFSTPRPGWEAFVEDADATLRYRGTDWESAGFIVDPTTTKGDLLGRSVAGSVRIAVGSNNQILVADSTQSAGVVWKTLLATKGDLLGYDGTNLVSLGVGTGGYVLTADATSDAGWSWQPSAGGGGGGGDANIDGDTHPATPDPSDDEFEFGTTIDTVGSRFAGASPWTKRSFGGTIQETIGQGHIRVHGANGTTLVVTQPCPVGITGSDPDWEFIAKVQGAINGSDPDLMGLCIWNTGSTALIEIFPIPSSQSFLIQKITLNASSGASSFIASLANVDLRSYVGGISLPNYISIRKIAGTCYFGISTTGVLDTFYYPTSEAFSTFLGQPSDVGLAMLGSGTANLCQPSADFFRKLR